jgi:hypothetical protein
MVAASSATQRGFLPEPDRVARETQAIITTKSCPEMFDCETGVYAARREANANGSVVLSSSNEVLYNGAIYANEGGLIAHDHRLRCFARSRLEHMTGARSATE